MTDTKALKHLDLRGFRCPIPVIRLEAAMRSALEYEIFEVKTDDPVARIDIPYFCREAGHRVETLTKEAPKRGAGPDFCVFQVTRGPKKP